MVSLKELITETELEQPADSEERFISNNVGWEIYETLLTKLEDNSHYRIAYLDGVLEIVSPSKKHETTKSRLALLIGLYLLRSRIKHVAMGSTTFRNKAKKAGLEPDECYCIGEEKEVPDIAVEVIVSSGNLSKLETYRRLGVKEIWFWEADELKIYHLRDNPQNEKPLVFAKTFGYEGVAASEILPQLNIPLFVKCTLIPDSVQAGIEFENGIS